MRKLKIVLICTALVAGLVAVTARQGPNAGATAGDDVFAAQHLDARRPTAFETDPIIPAESVPDSKNSGHGSGPLRLTDW
jgi:hypothetical protein